MIHLAYRMVRYAQTLEVKMSDTKLAYSTTTDTDRSARLQFFAARNVALGKQRDDAQARLDALRTDIASIVDTASEGDLTLAIARIERLRTTEAKLVADVNRLNSKIR